MLFGNSILLLHTHTHTHTILVFSKHCESQPGTTLFLFSRDKNLACTGTDKILQREVSCKYLLKIDLIEILQKKTFHWLSKHLSKKVV